MADETTQSATENLSATSDPAADASSRIVDSLSIASPADSKPDPKPEAKPATPSPQAGKLSDADKRLPLRAFELDGEGRIKFRADGTPIKKPHRPPKPKPGEKLADGSIFEGGSKVEKPKAAKPAGSKVVTPQPAEPVTPSPGQSPDALGDDAGDVLTDGIDMIAETWIGQNGKMTDAEKTTIKKQMNRTVGGLRIPASLALGLFLCIYGLRVLRSIPRKPKQPKQPKEAEADGRRQSPSHPRTDQERKDDAGQDALQGYTW